MHFNDWYTGHMEKEWTHTQTQRKTHRNTQLPASKHSQNQLFLEQRTHTHQQWDPHKHTPHEKQLIPVITTFIIKASATLSVHMKCCWRWWHNEHTTYTHIHTYCNPPQQTHQDVHFITGPRAASTVWESALPYRGDPQHNSPKNCPPSLPTVSKSSQTNQ